ncbi:response regulator [Ramlibacter algicola]|uniref:histidine kinase n=1 Tax=Ramlibacter algicola TaxID=2795217 RepID=A0A934UT39_9BURK|nr:response regulator [Ramlibacter algicola]MBK0394541.1 response regulator [Ramlibacter algicola]
MENKSRELRGVDPTDVPVNILIVDDEPKNLMVLESILDDPGYRLVRATSGEDALLALMGDEFALLIFDVRMPTMSGFELAQLVKERRKTARVPIIFLTAYYNEDEHILEGYGSGAVDYLRKPVNPAVLRSKVSMFAELHRQGRALEQANRLLLGEVAERRNAEARLSELNATLDRRVRDRTMELQASEQQLMEAARRKDEFMATLAHELRNPLAPVRNAVEVLKRGPLEPEKLEWATRIIDRQVGSLSHLIDDLMDLSRINTGRIELKRTTVTLGDVLAEAIETVRPHVDAAGHDMAVLLPDVKLAVDGDPTRLVQAFVNLLHNAVKYTDPGGRIEVGVVVEKGAATITIRDTGIGIPPDQLEAVFEMFTQVEQAQSRSRGGLGIGLALTQRLIALHDGHIKAYSEGLGRGSRFLVTLPLVQQVDHAPQAADAAAPAADGPQPGLDIVVADDNADAAETLAQLLEAMGHRVRTAADGAAAVRLVLQRRPQLAILDIGMPEMDGLEACKQIVAAAGAARPMLVALTGWGQSQDIARSGKAGFDRHLVKPVDAQQLEQLLADCAERVPGPSANGARSQG